MKNCILILGLLLISIFVKAQNPENLRSEQAGDKINIFYKIKGSTPNQSFKVTISCKTSAKGKFIIKTISGDVGGNVKGGKIEYKAVWDVLKDIDELNDAQFFAEILINKGGNSNYTNTKISSGNNYTETVENLNIEMVFVKGGDFSMGCVQNDVPCEKNEVPDHSVTLSDYYIGKTEVTQKQWRQVMGNDPPKLGYKNCDECPVEGVSWNDIQEFIDKLNQLTGKTYCLPTEAQWEYAAHGGIKTAGYNYSGSNNIDDVAWYIKNSEGKTHPVGQKQPNELGIYDMSGNVWELCYDLYDIYNRDNQTNPKGALTGVNRVRRGGGASWGVDPSYCKVTRRNFINPVDINKFMGFRLALMP